MLRNVGVTTEQALAEAGLTAGQVKRAYSNGVLTASEGVKTTAVRATTLALWKQTKALLATPQGIATATIVIAGAIIAAYKAWEVSAKEVKTSIDALKQSQDKLSETKNELVDITTQIEKLEKLKRQRPLSLTEDTELSKLKQQKTLLEDTARLLKTQNKLKETKAIKNATKFINQKESAWWNPFGGFQDTIQGDLNEYNNNADNENEKDIVKGDIQQKILDLQSALFVLKGKSDSVSVNAYNKAKNQIKILEETIYTAEELAKINFDKVISDDKFSGVTKDLKELGEQGKLTAGSLNDPKYQDFIKALVKCGVVSDTSKDSLEKIANEFNNLGSSIDNTVALANSASKQMDILASVKDVLSPLSSILGDFNKKGQLTGDSLDKINKGFKDIVPNISEYILRLADTSLTADELQGILGDLTVKTIENKIGTEKLASMEENLVAKMLDSCDVANSSKIAHELVTSAKLKNMLQTLDLNKVTSEEIQELMNMATQCGYTQIQMNNLTTAMSILGKTDLNLESKCQQLLQMAKTAGIAMASLGQASILMDNIQEGGAGGFRQIERGLDVTSTIKESIQEVLTYFGGLNISTPKITSPTENAKSNKSSSEATSVDPPTIENPNLKEIDNSINYSDTYDEWLTDRSNAIAKYESDNNKLTEKLSEAIATGDMDAIQLAFDKIKENRKNAQADLALSAEQGRKFLNENIMPILYSVAPELQGKTINGISEIEIADATSKLEQAVKDQENAAIETANANEIAKTNLKNAWSQRSYELKSANKNKEDNKYKAEEQDYKNKLNELESADTSNKDRINQAKYVLEQFKANVSTAKNYFEKFGLENGSGEFSDKWNELNNGNDTENKQLRDFYKQTSEDYISKMDFYGWKNGDSKVEARKRILERIQADWWKGLYKTELEYQKDLEQARQDFISSEREIIDELEKAISRETEAISESGEAIEKQVDKYQSLLDIKKKSFEITNNLNSAQKEVDKAFADAKLSTQYLDEETRKLIFNEDDYNKLTSKIKNISEFATSLTNQYYGQINNLSDSELYLREAITAEYERQLAMKERELEIAQAEVELQRKQQQLDNVLAEKNVRQMVEKDGNLQWEWVSDSEKVRQATQDFLDAQSAIEDLELQSIQQREINNRQANIDDLNSQKLANEQQIKMLNEATANLKRAIEDCITPIKTVDELANSLAMQGIPSINSAVNGLLEAFSKITNEDYKKVKTERSNSRTVVSSVELPGSLWSGAAWFKKIPVGSGYATGTDNSTQGWHPYEEEGTEITLSDGRKLKYFEGGEIVMDKQQADNIFALSKLPIQDLIGNSIGEIKLPKFSNNETQTTNYSLNGDIVLNNPINPNECVRTITNALRNKF